VRTLVISDLHLGQSGGVSVLERPAPLAALIEALGEYDRLVLLGDVLELLDAHPSHSRKVAEPILRTIAERMGSDKQLLVVPGNHDHGMVSPWARGRGAALEREDVVPVDASPLLTQVVSWLEATTVEIRYPGVWLGDGIWATHGHYLNQFLRPMSSWGLHARTRVGPQTPAEFESLYKESARPPMLEGLPPERWLDRHVPPRLAPLTARLLGHQMLSHAIPAFAKSTRALGVEAEWIIFGHVHRRGPRERDHLDRWRDEVSGARLVNTGSWRYEPVVARGQTASSGYWPGGAVAIGDDGVPRSVGLLDGLTEAELLSR
jgi:UDP-2,3-diacylglucosamine pyrophosphatase LpxH